MKIFPVTFLCFACMERDVSKSEATQVFQTTSSEIEIPPVLNKKSKKIELQLLQSSPIYVFVSLRRSHDQVRGIKMEDSPRSNLYWWCSSRPMDRGNFSFPIWIQSRSKYKWERDKWGLSLAKTMKLIDKKHFLNGSRGQWQNKMTLITHTSHDFIRKLFCKITILVIWFYKPNMIHPLGWKGPDARIRGEFDVQSWWRRFFHTMEGSRKGEHPFQQKYCPIFSTLSLVSP